jgi:hypothetical protein
MSRPRPAFMDAPPIPCASIAPGRIHWYEMPAHWYAGGRPGGVSTEGRRARPDPERSAYRSRRDALDAGGWLWLKSRPRWVRNYDGREIWMRQAMWTLTLPEPGPEVNARRALSSWLTWARNVAGLGSYLWVAELTRRGRVHFHIVVNDWMSQSKAAAAWLRALHREGLAPSYDVPPGKLVWVDAVQSSGQARGYVSKYVGKDFGNRADQLVHRLANVRDNVPDLIERGTLPDQVGAVLMEYRHELRARLVDALSAPNATRRRWGASQDLERRPLQVIGADDARTLANVHREVSRMGGVRWGERGEHGQACYFEVGDVTPDNCPVLFSLLNEAANG